MSDFLRQWDRAIATALADGKQAGRVWAFDRAKGVPFPMGRLVARTMHPSFMAANPPKHNPERDS